MVLGGLGAVLGDLDAVLGGLEAHACAEHPRKYAKQLIVVRIFCVLNNSVPLSLSIYIYIYVFFVIVIFFPVLEVPVGLERSGRLAGTTSCKFRQNPTSWCLEGFYISCLKRILIDFFPKNRPTDWPNTLRKTHPTPLKTSPKLLPKSPTLQIN